MSIYQEMILDHYRSPRHYGSLKKPTHTVSVTNPLCGDKLTMEIAEEKGVVKEIAFSGEGCAISQASASMLSEYSVGKTKDILQKLDKEFMLKLIGIQLSPNRLKCALLSLEALHKVIHI